MSLDVAGTQGKLVVVSGPSGVGKSTIDQHVVERTAARYSVSATTRAPRPGEVDGREYRFVDRRTFQRMVDHGQMLEWAEVYGNYYGTPLEPVQDAITSGETILLEIDVQGALQVHQTMPEATYVLIVPPSHEELVRRLRGRGTEDEESFRRRLGEAEGELARAREAGIYTHTVVNDELDRATNELISIVEA
jgi:guanylate kinase